MKLDPKIAEKILKAAAEITENTENRGEFRVTTGFGDSITMSEALKSWAAWIRDYGMDGE